MPAPSAASSMLPCALPKVMTMNATSRPFEQHALEGQREPVPVEPGAFGVPCGARLLLLAGEDLRLVVQRLVAARAQDRLAQPLQPEGEEQRRRR